MNQKPKVGDRVVVRGHEYIVIRVRPFGTIDAQSVTSGACVRISGLAF